MCKYGNMYVDTLRQMQTWVRKYKDKRNELSDAEKFCGVDVQKTNFQGKYGHQRGYL